uniref:Uncharacterized protein n=1 Tax=Anser cygnoides TaxID=8845 RepID=A0A8B9EBM7_ANSCY
MNDTSVQSWEINEKTKQNKTNYYWKSPFPGRTLLLQFVLSTLQITAEKVSVSFCWLSFALVAIEAERTSELKRIARIEFQSALRQQAASDLHGTRIGARRPLPPSEHKLMPNTPRAPSA